MTFFSILETFLYSCILNSRSGTEAFWKIVLVDNFLKIILLKSIRRFFLLETQKSSVNMSSEPSILIRMEA